jgi:acyl-CoA thioester hydrolase
MTIEPGWIDYNGHLNMAYYTVLLDRALDEALLGAGLGPDYVRDHACSYMTVETHICYVREVLLADPVRVASRVLDVDAKRLHMFAELLQATDGWVAATAEMMFLHVDMNARKTVPWPPLMRARLEAMRMAASALPRPKRSGRSIGIAHG